MQRYFDLRRKGFFVPFTDVVIAASAMLENVILWYAGSALRAYHGTLPAVY